MLRRPNPRSTLPESISTEEHQHEEDDMEDFKKAFQLLDVDRNGEITRSDLESFMKANLDESPTETDLQEMIIEV